MFAARRGGRLARPVRLVAVIALVAGLALHGGRAFLALKGALASVLISRAFERHLHAGGEVRPWPWADHHPVARLSIPRIRVTRHVLAGASGSSMAFGPGHVDGTSPMETRGNRVVAGHRDTWLAFAGELRAGDELFVTTRSGTARFVVEAKFVVADTATWLLQPTADDRLTLITCWPLDGMRPADRRLVVIARAERGNRVDRAIN